MHAATATSAPKAPQSARLGINHQTLRVLQGLATPDVGLSLSTRTRAFVAPIAALLLASLAALPPASVARGHFRPAAATTVGGTYHALQPTRILDTRGGPALGPGGLLNVPVAGHGGVPTGAAAVVMNVTVTDTTAPSVLIVYPTGVPTPMASNLNWLPGQTVPNLVEVALGTNGQVSIYNSAGSVDVVLDVEGYYTTPALSPGPDGLFNPVVPARLLDTRTGNGAPPAKLGPAAQLDLQVTGRGPVPATGVSAVVMNLTVTNPTAPSFLTAWPTGSPMPTASNLNFTAGLTVPNRVVVPVGAGGKVSIYNLAGTVDVVADVNGWFTDSTVGGTGGRYSPLTPARILDTRYNVGGYADAWGTTTVRPLTVAGAGGVPLMTDPNPPTAVVANITVTNTTQPSFLTAWPDGAAQPTASDLNWTGGTVPNLVVVQMGTSGMVDLYNLAGCADVVVDVVGYYTGPLPSITSSPVPPTVGCPPKNWLSRLNFYRATAGLGPVSENVTYSQGDYAHALWMVKNNTIMHGETPGTPYYTAAGDLAGQKSNIAVQSSTSATDTQFIDFWMGAPFHAIAMVDPRLQQTGYGSYREVTTGWQAAAALNVIQGNPFSGGTYPVYWPGNGSTVPLRQYSGNEFPDPLQACPGYSGAVGLPVFIQVGGFVSTTAGPVHSFTGNGTPLAHCVIDSTNSTLAPYLTSRGGVIVIPQAPLQPGVLYTVALTVNGVPYTWSFHVS